MRRTHFILLGLSIWGAGVFTAQAQHVSLIRVDGAIGPATSGYIARAIDEAHKQASECLIIQLDTPGGLLDSTKTIVQSLLASPIPTVVYVSPAGGSATSAGCFITLAADVAAMAPTTTIGAAHPVGLQDPGGGEGPDDTMKEKLRNYSVSFIESIAARRGRNVEWAASAVRESASITADEALKLNVIEIIATDLTDLLRQIDGRTIGGRTLQTLGVRVMDIPMSPRERVFQRIWRPEVLFILMLVAIYGILGELSNPGAIFPGVVGAIALILVLYMSAVLPVNLAGIALIVVAIALFVADVFTPTHGALSVGGLVAFLIGSLMLFDRSEPMYRLPLTLILPAAILTGAFFMFVVGKGLRAQQLPVAVGPETLIGKVSLALTPIDARGGKIFIEGEYWNVVSDVPIAPSQSVEIISRKGLTLTVRPTNHLSGGA